MNSKLQQAGLPRIEPLSSSHDPATIQQALDDILTSAPFRTTRQCQDLLRYIVDNTLAGQDQLLRERVIGAEVFSRRPDYDTGEDPVVRIRAAEVRKRLAQYYQAITDVPAVRINVPPGSYRATFDWTLEAAPAMELETQDPAFEAVLERVAVHPLHAISGMSEAPICELRQASWISRISRRRRVWAALLLTLVLVGAALWAASIRDNPGRSFSSFWAPLLDSPRPVLICIGTNAVYRLSDEFMKKYMQEHHIEAHGQEFYVNWEPGQKIDAHDLQRAWNSFVALGDVSAISETVATLTRQGKAYQERFPPDISFAELHDSPAVLIGGFNNYMALTVTKDLRFTLEDGNHVADRQQKSRSWSVKPSGDSHDTEDYAVVSRLVNADTGGPVVIIAGIGQYGTQAAADFVASPQRVADLVKNAPSGWKKMNLQTVLHVKVIDFRPVSIEVIASHYW